VCCQQQWRQRHASVRRQQQQRQLRQLCLEHQPPAAPPSHRPCRPARPGLVLKFTVQVLAPHLAWPAALPRLLFTFNLPSLHCSTQNWDMVAYPSGTWQSEANPKVSWPQLDICTTPRAGLAAAA
jgi:hypothetical protein